MTERESLWYLIKGLLNGSYTTDTFCSEFTRIYNLEVDYNDLTPEENYEFNDLCEMAERFSDDEEELKIPHIYYNENQIMEKAKYIMNTLK